jgi:hypothetical protein
LDYKDPEQTRGNFKMKPVRDANGRFATQKNQEGNGIKTIKIVTLKIFLDGITKRN